MDKTLAITLATRAIQASGSLLTLFFVAKFLSKAEQGYYYTFTSLLGLQIFFELGFSGVITQYAAHEAAHLRIDGTAIHGEGPYLSRISSLLRFSVKWFAWMAALAFIVLVAAGIVFFTKYETDSSIAWNWPWIILALGTAISIFVTPLLAFMEGLGFVQLVAKLRLIQQLVQITFTILFLSMGCKLFSGALALVGTIVALACAICATTILPMIKRLWVLYHPEHKLNFRTEVLPYQWRIAVSWVSGYFIFQLFNPVIFAVEGPVAAGKMGMTLAVLNGILSLSLSWFSTRIPVLSGFIARRQFTELDAAFRKIFRQATTVTFFFLLIFVVGVSLMQHLGIPFGERFLSSWPLINMSFCILISSIIYGMAVYLRCHKKEPLLIQSVLMGGLSAVCIVVLGHYYGLTGITISYTILSLVVGLFGTSIIFVHKKKEWHK